MDEFEDVDVDVVDEFVEVKLETEPTEDSDLEIIQDPLGDGDGHGAATTSAMSTSTSTSLAPAPTPTSTRTRTRTRTLTRTGSRSPTDETPLAETDYKFTTYTRDLPECWNKAQCNNFKLVNKWLLVKNGKLGCKVCSTMGLRMMAADSDEQRFTSLTTGLERNARPPQDWITCQVYFTGRTSITRQGSLRKKIFEHKKSKFHLQALAFEETVEQSTINEQLSRFKEQLDANSSMAVFTSVYETVKRKLPFASFQAMCSLPGLENLFSGGGGGGGGGLTAEKVFGSILGHIASKLRESMIARLVCDNTKRISIVMHETGILNHKAMLAVHFKFHIICGREIFHSCVFFDLLPLTSNSSDEVVLSLINCLKKNNIDMEYLRKNLVAFIFDGESEVLGRTTNVAATLTRQIIWFPNVNIKYDFNAKLYDDVRHLYQSIASGVILPSTMLTTTAMADAMFVNVAGRPAENFNAAQMANTWLTEDKQTTATARARRLSNNLLPNIISSTSEMSNDMTLAATVHDDQSFIIDLQSQSESNSLQETDNAWQQSTNTSHSTASASANNVFANDGVCGAGVKRKKQSSHQTDRNCNSDSDTDFVDKAKETSPSDLLCTCKQDQDRLFLLSLLPFMKQLNNRENLEFRTQVQQLLQEKFTSTTTNTKG